MIYEIVLNDFSSGSVKVEPGSFDASATKGHLQLYRTRISTILYISQKHLFPIFLSAIICLKGHKRHLPY